LPATPNISRKARWEKRERMVRNVGQAVDIRIAVVADAPKLAALAGELGYPATAEQMLKRLEAASIESRHRIFVAELDSVVGWIHVALVHSLLSELSAEIRGLVVADSHQGGGIGSQLVAAAERWAREQGCTRIRVRTNVLREKARVFYAKLGYQVTKRQEIFDKTLTVVHS
jgi:GNAT superfamily N-acetyltransferase